MGKTLIVALRVAAVTWCLTGIVYPLVATVLAQLVFPRQANGSMVDDERGNEVGSALIAQAFSKPWYFQPRPSAAGANGWDAAASAGSNLGPTSKKLRARVHTEIGRLLDENPGAHPPVPGDLVTASASGLDPHISPDAALWQLPRVAAARNVPPERVRALVESLIEGRTFGVLGERRVNVLLLNLALDRDKMTACQTVEESSPRSE
jgi:K+-transporting ATPase ATPase C chain